jgi:hypothetical protein
MTPREKARLAARNVIEPFNALTILSLSAIEVGSNAHSAYGPGMTGWGRNVGVSYSQDITGEFFSTFLIPSIIHQDPHYHRMPNATIKRRVGHAIEQVVWTQGDNGKPMVNYADIVGFAIEDEIGDLYVPGQQTNLPASAERYGITLATAPIENFVNEFVPDVARRIHVRVVLIQRIINQVAKTSGPRSPQAGHVCPDFFPKPDHSAPSRCHSPPIIPIRCSTFGLTGLSGYPKTAFSDPQLPSQNGSPRSSQA